MSGILENFFKISLVLTIMVLGMNVFLINVYPTIMGTGDKQPLFACDLSGTGNIYQNQIEQQGDNIGLPTTNNVTFDNIQVCLQEYVKGYDNVLYRIFGDDGLQFPQIAFSISVILSAFQVAGLAYIVFALASTLTGGGSP